MSNNPIEELRKMETPVTEKGWEAIVNDPRYRQRFGRRPKMSPKGRIAIVASVVAVLVTVPVLIKTLTRGSSESAGRPLPAEASAPQPATADIAPATPQATPAPQPQASAPAASKPTAGAAHSAATQEQSALTAIAEARTQSLSPISPKEPAPAPTVTPSAPLVIPEQPVTTPAPPKAKTPAEQAKPSQTVIYQDGKTKSEPEVEEPEPDADQFFIPSAFTPNGDGLNDLFLVKANFEPSNFEMTIFTRTSERVFHSRDMNIGWDGKMHGQALPFGMYVYIIKYKDSQGNEQQQQGQILLIP